MKPILSFLFISLALHVTAQKIRFTDHRNQWHTTGLFADCAYFATSYYYGADTVFHGMTYKPILTSRYLGAFCSMSDGPPYGFYVREDTDANMVYFTLRDGFSDTDEHILYNYNLNAGDTITYWQYGSPQLDSVTSIDSVFISGVSHKVFYIQTTSLPTPFVYTIVEGIGSAEDPLAPAWTSTCFEYFEALVCFAQDATYPLVNVPVETCEPGYPVDTFRNGAGCLSLNIHNSKPPEPPTIVPNPANDQINVTSDQPFAPNTFISVYDMTGRSILHIRAERQNTVTVNTSEWADGLYMVIIPDNNGILKKEKIVVQH